VAVAMMTPILPALLILYQKVTGNPNGMKKEERKDPLGTTVQVEELVCNSTNQQSQQSNLLLNPAKFWCPCAIEIQISWLVTVTFLMYVCHLRGRKTNFGESDAAKNDCPLHEVNSFWLQKTALL
jgi:hypothetical protein